MSIVWNALAVVGTLCLTSGGMLVGWILGSSLLRWHDRRQARKVSGEIEVPDYIAEIQAAGIDPAVLLARLDNLWGEVHAPVCEDGTCREEGSDDTALADALYQPEREVAALEVAYYLLPTRDPERGLG